MWIRLEKKVESGMWTHILSSKSNYFFTSIFFNPGLRNKTNFIQGAEPCVFFNEQIEFKFTFRFTGVTHLQAEVEYFPKFRNTPGVLEDPRSHSGFVGAFNAENYFNSHECLPIYRGHEERWVPGNAACKQYLWLFDSCLIKLHFANESNTKVLTKRLGMQCPERLESLCKRNGRGSYFIDPSFATVEELNSSLNFSYSKNKNEFLAVEIEILAQLHLVECYLSNKQRFGEQETIVNRNDKNCLLENDAHFSYSATSRKAIRLSIHRDIRSVMQMNQLSPGSEYCDLVLEIGASGWKTLAVHKLLLAAKSPVFRTMFGNGWKEPISGRLQIDENISFSGVSAFVNFFYETSNINIFSWDVNLCLEVLLLAHFYQVVDLLDYCRDHIMVAADPEFSLDASLQIIEAGKLFEFQELVTRALQWIKRHMDNLNGDEKLKLDNFFSSANGFVKEKMNSFLKVEPY